MRQVALVAIDAIRKIVEILFLIWVQVLALLKRVDGLKGFAKCDLITYRPRKINSAELRVGLRKGLRKEGHIVTLRRFKLSSSLNPLEYFRPCQALEGPRIGRGRWLGASTVYFLIAHRSRDSVQIQQVQVTTRAKRDFAVVCSHCDARGPWAYMKDLSDLLSLATLGSVKLVVS
jgi:hypothetical protein